MKPVQIFYSYSHKDEDLVSDLVSHLTPLKREGLIQDWRDRNISAGEKWDEDIEANLEKADIILLIISPSFVASEYCYSKEMKRALERHKTGQAKVIPIIVQPVEWKRLPFGKIQALPKDGKPLTTWRNRHEGWLNVVMGIRKTIDLLRSQKVSQEEIDDLDFDEVFTRSLELHTELKALRKEVSEKPDEAEAHFQLGGALALYGTEIDEGIECLKKAITLQPDHLRAYMVLGWTLQHNGRDEETIDVLRKGIKIDPNFEFAHLYIGLACLNLKRLPEAKKSFEEAIRCNPKAYEAHANLGSVYWDMEEFDKAEQCLKEAIRLNPEVSEPHYNLGLMYLHIDRLEESIKSLKETLRISPDHSGAQEDLKIALIAAGKRKADLPETASELSPHEVENLFFEGVSLMRRNHMNEGMKCLQKVVEADPKHLGALALLGMMYSAVNRHQEAVKYFEQIIETDISFLANNPDYLDAYEISKNTLAS